jgi:hypothetical protein
MQTLDFKNSPPEIKNLFISHMTLTEKLMFEQASESPAFSQRLQMLKQFPLFFAPKPLNELSQLPPEMEEEMTTPNPEELSVA